MIIIQKKLKRVVPYRLIYWPTEAVLKEIVENLPLTHYARVEFANIDLDSGRCIVRHSVSLTLLIDLQRPLGTIYKDLIENARIRIHKAEKLGSRITLRRYTGGPDEDQLVPVFVELYNGLARGKPTQAAPVSAAGEYSFFPNADLFMAYLDGLPICGHLNLIDRQMGIVRLQDSANQRFDDQATARLAGIVNVYLHWYELEKYREEGFTSYDFGSLGHLKDSVGVNRFKMQFGGTIIREHNYILAGMPGAWRTTSRLLSLLSSRWQRRVKMQRAGDRWRHMPLEKIRETMETSISDYQRSLQARPLASNHSSSRLTRVAADSDLPPEPGFENKHGKASERI